MKRAIIGTAGHVDHGKTELIKALTGVDTDRLAEEKKRGITIDLGFARLDFPDGSCASIVDVPGHERFIKNMLAGAGGVDLAMLVVAADEGFMPQTVEHLDILQLLGVKGGLIVLTKTDLVDEDWLNMLEEDVKSRVRGTFLEDKPILRTSVRTGEGVEALREALHDLTLHAEEKSARTPFRLPIDRVFSVDGFGTIVTGTLIDGHIAVGDEAQLMPLGNQCRVRNLQVHGRDVSAVYAGQRAAVNLAGIKKESISRGDVLCRTDSMQPSLMLDVKLQNLPDSKRIIESGSRLHIYHGAAVRKGGAAGPRRAASGRELLCPTAAERSARRAAGRPLCGALLFAARDCWRRDDPGRASVPAQAIRRARDRLARRARERIGRGEARAGRRRARRGWHDACGPCRVLR